MAKAQKANHPMVVYNLISSPTFYVFATRRRGKAVKSLRSFRQKEVISRLEGIGVCKPTKTSVYVPSENQHIDPTNGLQFLNHSCCPNARFENRDLIGITDIDFKEEITIDYRNTEPTISHPFKCECGETDCSGFIGTGHQESKRHV
ncbi:MAG: hypothetical protein KDA84_11045 [Planctomycetaceae bacterium]|nr:hypothetical protein [Planctomycetaceae bacterium]